MEARDTSTHSLDVVMCLRALTPGVAIVSNLLRGEVGHLVTLSVALAHRPRRGSNVTREVSRAASPAAGVACVRSW